MCDSPERRANFNGGMMEDNKSRIPPQFKIDERSVMTGEQWLAHLPVDAEIKKLNEAMLFCKTTNEFFIFENGSMPAKALMDELAKTEG